MENKLIEKQRILIVEDEPDLCEILKFNLGNRGFDVTAVHTAEDALEMDLRDVDLFLLDVMLPGMSGFELARHLKEDVATAAVPVIFLTARDAEEDTLLGFDIGADDYVAKPFSLSEVVARVKAVLHRTVSTASTIHHAGISMNKLGKVVTIDGEPVALTRIEFELLWHLFSHRGMVFNRQELIHSVWPHDVIVTERAVDVNVTRLRKKLGAYGDCIVTRQGYGYVFEI